MKKRTILLLISLLMLSMFTVQPASAKTSHAWANGSIESYVDAWSSKIVWGRWYVEVIGSEVKFEAVYLELNLDEGVEKSPVGSIDVFIQTFSVEGSKMIGGAFQFWGTLHVRKWWAKLDGSREWVEWDTHPVTITLTVDDFFCDVPPPGPGPGPEGQDWDRVGHTLFVHIDT